MEGIPIWHKKNNRSGGLRQWAVNALVPMNLTMLSLSLLVIVYLLVDHHHLSPSNSQQSITSYSQVYFPLYDNSALGLLSACPLTAGCRLEGWLMCEALSDCQNMSLFPVQSSQGFLRFLQFFHLLALRSLFTGTTFYFLFMYNEALA